MTVRIQKLRRKERKNKPWRQRKQQVWIPGARGDQDCQPIEKQVDNVLGSILIFGKVFSIFVESIPSGWILSGGESDVVN